MIRKRVRADRLLVERAMFESRAKAQAAIAAGLVSADGAVVRKASDEIAINAVLNAAPAHAWVSRGGVKLSAALDAFGFDPVGCVCLDVGASTGGFTDVLLARGAARVYAVDVGRAQLHERLRGDARVISLEQTDIRSLQREALSEAPSLATIDVSFISLTHVLPAVTRLLASEARLIALIKPQFEVGPGETKKGVVRDEARQQQVCDDIAAKLRELGWQVSGIIPSPILGGDGNREFPIGARRSA
jgi:23S rRNA (cytidine1920-2'-O)/16S rRNA (cytidine1409-2'-O)-methyltransferase